jgi:LuxR family transcriptional regulator, maltose regulon positive regulatory protein
VTDLLGRVVDVARAAGRDGSRVEAALVGAFAHHANGDPDSAAACGRDLGTSSIAGRP